MTIVDRSAGRVEQRARLSGVLQELDLDAAVVTSYQGVSYFAGTNIITQTALPERLEFFLLFADGSAALLLCNIETGMAKTQTDVTDVSEYVEFADVPALALARLLEERGLTKGRVGIESRRLHAEAYQDLRKALPEVELLGIDHEVEESQSVKTEAEAAMLKYAAQTTLNGVLGAAADAKPGDSELSVAADMSSQITQNGGIYVFMVFSSGARALGAHVEASSEPLEEGTIWRVDLGSRFFDTINSDLARVGVVGEPSERQRELMAALHAIQHAGFATIEPGRPASDVFRAVEREFERQGLPFFMPHVGHGLGIGLHEAPILEPRNTTPLAPGMVVNVEPMIRLDDEGECYHTEDLAHVIDDGYELLTQPQEELIPIAS
jgi:Xaa-Pro aminopeptidase